MMKNTKAAIVAVGSTVLLFVLFFALEARPSSTSVVRHIEPMHTIVGGGIDVRGKLAIIGVEGQMDASEGRLAHFDVPFQLNGRSVSKFQATISYRTDAQNCSPQALMLITVDGVQAYRSILKLTRSSTAVSTFVNYDFSLPITHGKAQLHVETDGGCASDWEIQGLMQSR